MVTLEAVGLEAVRFYDIGVAGIHRLFHRLDELRRAAAVIVVAGMEGALPSVVGGIVSAPIVAGADLGGVRHGARRFTRSSSPC